MLGQPIAITSRPISDRARRRAVAQLSAPPRRPRGARRSSRAPRRRPWAAVLEVLSVSAVLLGASLLAAPELAREMVTVDASGMVVPTELAGAAPQQAGAPRAVPQQAGAPRAVPQQAGAAATLRQPGEAPQPAAATELVSRLDEARSMALRRKEPVTIVLDPGTGRLWMVAGYDVDAEPTGAGRIALEGGTVLDSRAPRPTFTFAEDGAAEADSVWVRDRGQVTLVLVDGRTGRPRATPQ